MRRFGLVVLCIAWGAAACSGSGKTVAMDVPDVSTDTTGGDAPVQPGETRGPETTDAPDTAGGPCKFSSECASGLACILDQCLPCTADAAAECEGLVCMDGACTECTPEDGDEMCQEQYGNEAKTYKCENGYCVPESCESGLDCHLVGKVCTAQGLCQSCGDTNDCLDDTNGQYADGAQCIEGLCWPPDSWVCTEHQQCLDDAPVCGDNHLCRLCQLDDECQEVLAVEQAVCVDGRCMKGDCDGAAPTDCPDGQVCKQTEQDGETEMWCSPCVDPLDDVLCVAQHAAHHKCIEGACLDRDCHGLADMLECTPEWKVCVDNMCAVCSGLKDPDGICLDAYGSEEAAAWICQDSQCMQGDAHSQLDCNEAFLVWVQDESGSFCTSCTELGAGVPQQDMACKTAYTQLHICQEGLCVTGCEAWALCIDPEAQECQAGQFCGENNRWQHCSSNLECQTAADNDPNWICEPTDPQEPESPGVCVKGCATGGPCELGDDEAPGQGVCDKTHHCIACTEMAEELAGQDAACEGAYEQLEYMCQEGNCVLGCDPAVTALCPGSGEECIEGQLCGTDNRWTDCETSNACQLAAKESHWVCDPVENEEMPEDEQQKLCQPGCVLDVGCKLDDGLDGFCDETNHCVGCSMAAEEQDDQDQACKPYGEKWVCELLDPLDPETPLTCVEGCEIDALCKPPEENEGSECLAGRVCGDDNRWRDCIDDDDCKNASGNDDKICEDYEQIEGETNKLCTDGCPLIECAEGMVCEPDNRCNTCAVDLDCAATYPDHYICDEEVSLCLPGCEVIGGVCSKSQDDNGVCVQGQVCGADHRWQACGANSDCQAQDDTLVCSEGGLCLGECNTEEECVVLYGYGRVCGADHFCTWCEAPAPEDDVCSSSVAGDQICKEQYGPSFVCSHDPGPDQDLCMPGCPPYQGGCAGGAVCSFTNRCCACASDQECIQNHGAGMVCLTPEEDLAGEHEDNFCEEGCKKGPITTCGGGLICKTNGHCKACVTDAECNVNYNNGGNPHVCDNGTCVAGECSTNADCESPQGDEICVGKFCVSCTAHGVAKLEDCPAGKVCCDGDQSVCDDGLCHSGTCCTALSCSGQIPCPDMKPCTNYHCECDDNEDCWAAYPGCVKQLDGVCDLGLNRCLTVPEILAAFGAENVVKTGHCLIKRKPNDPLDENYDCYIESEHIADTECRVCYPNTDGGGSILEPTPGEFVGEYPNNEFQATWCYINDADDDSDVSKCFKRQSDEALNANTGVRFWECKECRPDVADRSTLFKWVPPPEEPGDETSLMERVVCSDPAYFGTWGNPVPDGAVNDDGSAAYPAAGSPNGRCFQTRCHGMSWQPWLPLGMSGAGAVYQDLDIGGATGFIGSFGGGFGGGLPKANPGCFGKADCGE